MLHAHAYNNYVAYIVLNHLFHISFSDVCNYRKHMISIYHFLWPYQHLPELIPFLCHKICICNLHKYFSSTHHFSSICCKKRKPVLIITTCTVKEFHFLSFHIIIGFLFSLDLLWTYALHMYPCRATMHHISSLFSYILYYNSY